MKTRTPTAAEKETKGEEKPSINAPASGAPERHATDKPEDGDAKEASAKPTESTNTAKDAASALSKTDNKPSEPSPAMFRFSKPFLLGGRNRNNFSENVR